MYIVRFTSGDAGFFLVVNTMLCGLIGVANATGIPFLSALLSVSIARLPHGHDLVANHDGRR